MDTLRWNDGVLYLLDQRRLPFEEIYLTCTTWRDVEYAISVLAVRGAPAIGVAAAYAVILASESLVSIRNRKFYDDEMGRITKLLDQSRPTAVNLHWALMKMMQEVHRYADMDIPDLTKHLEMVAMAIHDADKTSNELMGTYGADALAKGKKALTILTHCNAGALATTGIGTALGVIRVLHKRGLVKRVYVDETRPLLQGSRLTATELFHSSIPVTVITDNMAAWTMKTCHVDAVIVGADRIAANGDTANKIGTFGVALAAAALDIPFYVAAPVSTFDLTLPNGEAIPIEERDHQEVRTFGTSRTVLPEIPVFNPAFDVTDHQHITAIITERGVLEHPDAQRVASFFEKR